MCVKHGGIIARFPHVSPKEGAALPHQPPREFKRKMMRGTLLFLGENSTEIITLLAPFVVHPDSMTMTMMMMVIMMIDDDDDDDDG